MSEPPSDQIGEQRPHAEEPPRAEEQPRAKVQPAAGAPEPAVPGAQSEPAPGAPDSEVSGAEDEPEAAEHGGEPEPEEPEDELDVARRERAEYLALAQRTQADFENYRKRSAKETAATGRRAKSGLVAELLPVVDNLERALASAGEQEEHLAGGVRLVHSALVAVLARNGVEQFDPAGEKFDPAFHEALSTREEDGAEPGVVVDVVEKGYSLSGTVLRPARVVVSG